MISQAILPEVTSSGLSHTEEDFFPGSDATISLLSVPDSQDSSLYFELNYGILDIRTVDSKLT